MSGLETFGLVVLTMLISAITMAWAFLITDGDIDVAPWIAWGTGALMFVIVVYLWASGRPFPLGGGA